MAVYRRGKNWSFSFIFAGKRIQESAKTSRKSVAIEAEKRRHLELERAHAGLPTEDKARRILSVQDVVKPYLASYGINHRPKSLQFAQGRLANVTRLLGSVLLTDLTEERIKQFIAKRLNEGVSGRTVNMELGELSRAMGRTWSVLWPRVRKLEERKDVGRALSAAEEQRLLDAAEANDSPNRNRMLFTILKVALSTGMRIGEVLSLKWEQLDFVARVITVGRAKTSSGTGRRIPMTVSLVEAFAKHHSWFTKDFGECEAEFYVFPGREGRPSDGVLRPLNPRRPLGSVKGAWAKLKQSSGVNCRLHDLRHTAATKMAEAGAPESTMLAIMGHMSRAMLERYSHVRMEAKRSAVMALETPRQQAATTAIVQTRSIRVEALQAVSLPISLHASQEDAPTLPN